MKFGGRAADDLALNTAEVVDCVKCLLTGGD